MRTSIIINILNSHEAVRRQILYFRKMNLPEEVEIIFVDDGSNPPLQLPEVPLKNFTILATNDKRPWTQGLARNMGARFASGEYLMMTDIDHIFSKESIEASLTFTGDKMAFIRYYGILDENGNLITDIDKLIEFGLHPGRLTGRRGISAGSHGNTFTIRRSVFFELGGYKERHCVGMMHQGKRKGEDSFFNWAYTKNSIAGRYKLKETGPNIYMFPIGKFHVTGDENPHGLFHSLSHESVPQPMML